MNPNGTNTVPVVNVNGGSTNPTAAQSGIGNPTGNGNYGPTVSNPYGWSTVNGVITQNSAPATPASPTTLTNPGGQPVDPITGNGASTPGFAPNGDPTSQAGAYSQALSQAQGEIADTESYYQNLLNQDTVENNQSTEATRAMDLASGIAGGGSAAANQNSTTTVNNQRTQATTAALASAMATVYQNIASNAASIEAAGQKSAEDALAAQQTVQANAVAQLKTIGSQGITGSMYQDSDPQGWSELLQQTGYTPMQLANAINASLPAAANLQQQTVAAPSATGNGTTVTVVTSSINPVTGATQQQQTSYNLAVPYADYNSKALITADDGTPIYINQQGQAINAETGQPYIPTTTLSQGQVLSNKATGAVIGQGQPTTTVVPLTSGTVNSGPAAGSATAPAGTSAPAGGSASSASVVGGGPNGTTGGGTATSSGPFANGLASNGQATWDSLAALPGNLSSQLSLLKADYSSPQAAYAAGMQWILNGGSTSGSGSNSSGGRGAVSGALSNSSSAIGAAILQSYGLGPQDADAIAGLSEGLSTSLQTATENQQGTQQFMTKAGAQVGILDNAIAKYGNNSASPLWNVATQAFQSNVVSDPALSSFQVSLQSFLQDYSRITTNSTGSSAAPTDAANATAQNKLNTLMSQGSLSAAIGTMVQEMNAVMSSYNSQVSSTAGDIHNLIQNYAASINQASGASDLGENGSTTSESAPSSPAGTTQMTGPDGQLYNVPNAQVQAFIAAGGKKQ